MGPLRKSACIISVLLLAALAFSFSSAERAIPFYQAEPWPREPENPRAVKPKAAPERWVRLIGEYGPENEPLYILENDAKLWALFGRSEAMPLQEIRRDTFGFAASQSTPGRQIRFNLDGRGGVL